MKLPGLDIPAIKAKIDTGATASSLHAFDVERFRRGGLRWVRFSIHPRLRSDDAAQVVEAEVIEDRPIKSSNGQVEMRPVIQMDVQILDRVWTADVTLANRDEMGFRMLLGRQALRRHFLVDPSRSFLTGQP